tara:strand:- start:1318 stop:1515 length:198 start_codon:yes stop_codon:yes gene_type:complete
MRQIDNDKLIENISEMINTLEYDSSRSPGKAKINAQTLVNLHNLKELYIKNSKKPTPKKEVSNDG